MIVSSLSTLARGGLLAAFSASLLVIDAGSTQAQDYTADELISLFEKQKDAVNAATSGAGLGQTRGLRIVTLDADGEVAEAGTPAEAGAVLEDQAQIAGGIDGDEQIVPVSFGDGIQINYKINFAYDSAALAASERARLGPVCEAIERSNIGTLRIVGHTDAAGSEEYNTRLSRLRAEEVARHLVEECGIDPARLQTLGRGEDKLLNPADPLADENRRVEFQALS